MMIRVILLSGVFALSFALSACSQNHATSQPQSDTGTSIIESAPKDLKIATFAGGCFWCMESPFEKLVGVSAVISGYTGGQKLNPTYKEVCSGKTGHTEAIQIHFDPKLIRYQDLLEVFWRQIDPTDPHGQFVDKGTQYRSEIFVHDAEQRKFAQQSKDQLEKSKRFSKNIATAITDASTYYRAEEYHQDYYKKEPSHYKRYRNGSGRDAFLDQKWGKDRVYKPELIAPPAKYSKPSKASIRAKLTDKQYYVTQENGTEAPFKNEFHDSKKVGIYVDIVSGEPLFSSTHKFNSGTGWPSFWQPLVKKHVIEKSDFGRTEVRSQFADSHLGHVFADGPNPTGLRYCINSASLRFIPVAKLKSEGFEEFTKLFAGQKK